MPDIEMEIHDSLDEMRAETERLRHTQAQLLELVRYYERRLFNGGSDSSLDGTECQQISNAK